MAHTGSDIIGWAVRRGGAFINLIWLVNVGVAAVTIWPDLTGPVWLNALGLGAIAAPAIAGILLGARIERNFERFALALFWTGMAAGLAATGGGLTGPAVFAFLLPPAVAAAQGDREAILKSAALSGLAALVVGALQLAGFIGPAQLGATLFAPFMLGATLAIAFGFACAALRAIRLHDQVRDLAERSRVRVQAFDQAPAALVACDEDGQIQASSIGLRALLPGLPRQLDNLPLSDFGFDEPERHQLDRLTRTAGHKPAEDTLGMRGARGRELMVRLQSRPIPGGSVNVLVPDVRSAVDGELNQMERERDRALEDSRAKSQYLASVSHELRTPLNAIIGFSDVMKARLFGPLPARYAEYADLIHESGQHLVELIGDVLDMSKIEADRYQLFLEEFDVAEVVSIAAKLMRLQAEEAGLSLAVEASDASIPVKADRKALRQILLNLLSNAVKFTPQGGAVVVMTRMRGDDLVLAVGDSGVGISADEAERLGQPYQQSASADRAASRGTGLGLSLVRALAELHGGTMEIASRPGEGTTVTITLPIIRRDRARIDTLPNMDVHDQIRRAQQAQSSLGPNIAEAR